MPIVKMKTPMVGNNFSYVAGDLILVTDEVSAAWIGADIAEPFEDKKKIKQLAEDIQSHQAPDNTEDVDNPVDIQKEETVTSEEVVSNG